ncbi:uncharacterized protein LOC123271741 [Cotesia glomerata]|uniref:uncharacterized protein LOC123271741 n=1 Tax=Cotesia glomerata TaxID=32391 RepID=UPI001D016985|nr:uncharacterized protein LOC123271741 [Cotesia glomerata]
MLLWLNNAPNNPLNTDSSEALRLINELVSVSTSEASGNIKLQTHKHTFTCYKRITSNQPQKCRFEAPFMPCRATSILVPMSTDDPGFHQLKKRYNEIRMNLDFNDYTDIDSFYEHNNVVSDEEYIQILRSGIQRPRVFLKRQPNEKWNNAFNPFLLSILKSNMDIQFITEEYSCAAYVVEYVNKTNRGISNLQRQIIQTMDEHPEFDIVDVTRKMSVDMLNTVEMTSQEAAWYLLREPMSKSSHKIEYIPTVWPIERQRMRKTQIELDKLQVGEDCTNIWKENWFHKYERRSSDLENISLAQFVAYYNIKEDGAFQRRKEPRTIRYRNYDISTDLDNHKREMVTLYIPFQNEETEVLADLKFLKTYADNEQVIVTARKEFESDLDIEKTMEICRQLCRNDNDDEDNRENVGIVPEPNPFQQLYNDPSAEQDNDLRLALLNKLGPIAKRRENLMDNPQFLDLMRSTNDKQRSLLLHTISHLINAGSSPLQIFFTGPAGCGKTFVIKLLMEIYNRFTDTDGHCNAYITCASTGKAAVAIDGTTVQTALIITLSKLLPLSTETALQYRTLFRYVKVIIIDEVSMIGAELLAQIDQRLKQISGAFDSNFGGYDIILIGDLRQLPPVRATPIYKHPKQRIGGPTLWQSLKFYELNQVMRQSNSQFANILTKIGNGEKLSTEELCLIESRFFTIEEVQELCPNGIRLFYSNQSVNAYNNKILTEAENKVISIATDIFTGYHGVEQLASLRQILRKKSTLDTGGLPYEIIFVVGKYYILTTNTDVSDGLANGAVGKLVYIELNENNEVTRVWLTFPSNKTGLKLRTKAAGYMQEHNIPINAVPINRRSSTIHLNNNKTMNAKRNHFLLISGCAMTIHKSQGGTFEEIVYQYDKNHPQQLLYVALSRVTTIEKLYIVTINNTATLFHGRCEPAALRPLKLEYERLSANPLVTLESQLLEFITKKPGLSIYTFNIQSLRAHNNDIIDKVAANSNILLLSETWTRDDEDISIPNFNCIVKYKRSNIRSGGVAIYQNNNDTTHIVTPSMDISLHHLQSVGVQHCAVGEICAAECKTENGQSIMLISIYISPNQPIGKITQFIHRSLIPFSAAVAAELNQGLEKQAMILSGDFNINFSSESGAILIDFLKTKFDLSINNNPNEPTKKHGTTIDAVFSRYLHTIETKIFISHFSYHKPLITYVDDRNVNES